MAGNAGSRIPCVEQLLIDGFFLSRSDKEQDTRAVWYTVAAARRDAVGESVRCRRELAANVDGQQLKTAVQLLENL